MYEKEKERIWKKILLCTRYGFVLVWERGRFKGFRKDLG